MYVLFYVLIDVVTVEVMCIVSEVYGNQIAQTRQHSISFLTGDGNPFLKMFVPLVHVLYKSQ